MPELPEVETVRLGLVPFVTGQTITNVVQNRPDLRVPFPENFVQTITGQTIKSLTRRGKYILFHLSNHQIIILHLGMSGVVRLYKQGESYEPQTHDHLVVDVTNDVKMVYNDPRRFGMIMMCSNNEIDIHPSFKAMGPEPFSDDFTPGSLYDSLKSKKTSFKSALLDQRVVAGLGNIYVSEALFDAGLRPTHRSASLTRKKASLLHKAIVDVLSRAIEAGGSTLRDYKHTDGEMGYFQHQFSVYDKQGQACPGCTCTVTQTGGIKKIVQSGRSTYYCPQKQ